MLYLIHTIFIHTFNHHSHSHSHNCQPDTSLDYFFGFLLMGIMSVFAIVVGISMIRQIEKGDDFMLKFIPWVIFSIGIVCSIFALTWLIMAFNTK